LRIHTPQLAQCALVLGCVSVVSRGPGGSFGSSHRRYVILYGECISIQHVSVGQRVLRQTVRALGRDPTSHQPQFVVCVDLLSPFTIFFVWCPPAAGGHQTSERNRNKTFCFCVCVGGGGGGGGGSCGSFCIMIICRTIFWLWSAPFERPSWIVCDCAGVATRRPEALRQGSGRKQESLVDRSRAKRFRAI